MIKKIIIVAIRSYQLLISSVLAPKCRFHPTCSAYSIQAIEKHSIFKGIYLSIKRILRCHPFSEGGFDPVK